MDILARINLGSIAAQSFSKNWQRASIALASGMAAALAPEPVKAWPLAWVALVPLWLMAIAPKKSHCWTSALTHAGLGMLWGIGYYGIVLVWLTGLHPLTWLGVPWLASVAIALFCWFFVTFWGALWAALWAAGFSWVNDALRQSYPRQPLRRPSDDNYVVHGMLKSVVRVWVGVALWCGLDVLWSQGVLYWPSLAFTQSPHNLAVLHVGQWTGPIGVTATIVAVNGFLAEAVYWARCFPKSSIPNPPVKTCGAIALLLFISVHGLGGWLYSRPLASTNGDPLTVGIVQGNIPTRIKLYEEGLRRAFSNYTQGYEVLADEEVDTVLTPEGAIPLLWQHPIRSRTSLYQAVLDRGTPIWLGTFFPQGQDYAQSLILLNDEGDVISQYNKVKLVPLGEYIPMAEILGGLVNRLSPLQSYMIPGDEAQQVETPWGHAIVGICYESAFSGFFRQQAATGGEYILTASNNDPYSTAMMAQHQAQDIMRAIETDRWAIRATNTGYSGVVDPHGRILWRSRPNIYQTHSATIYRRQTQTLYVRWGNWFAIALVGGAIAAIFFYSIQRIG